MYKIRPRRSFPVRGCPLLWSFGFFPIEVQGGLKARDRDQSDDNEELPGARVVWTHRPAKDIVSSLCSMRETQHKACYRLVECTLTVGFLYGAGAETLIFVTSTSGKYPKLFVSRQENQSQLWIPRKPR